MYISIYEFARVFISKLFMIEQKKENGRDNLVTYMLIKRKVLHYGTNIKRKIKKSLKL